MIPAAARWGDAGDETGATPALDAGVGLARILYVVQKSMRSDTP